MRILYHHRTASRDGQSTHIEEMIKGLRRLGHDVLVVSPAVEDVDQSGGSGGWVGQLKRLPKPVYEILEIGYSVVAYRRLAQAIREFEPDIIYERYNLFMLAGVLAARRFGLPLILEVNAPMALERREYGGLGLPRLADWAERYVWRGADAVLPVSDVLGDILRRAGVSPEKIGVIPNGVDPDHYRDLPARASVKEKLGFSHDVVIGFTGFVREWDRLDRVVTWLAGYRGKSRPVLFVVGDGPARSEIETLARTLGVSERVRFTGVVPRTEVPRQAIAFDIALQTALVPYASPLCLFEYLAMGQAIVAPDQPNHHEILSDGLNAVLYDPAGSGALESAIQRLCEDEALRETMGENAGRLIAERGLTWLQHAETVAAMASRMRGPSTVADRREQGAR